MCKKVKFRSVMNYLRVIERILTIIKNIMVAIEPNAPQNKRKESGEWNIMWGGYGLIYKCVNVFKYVEVLLVQMIRIGADA